MENKNAVKDASQPIAPSAQDHSRRTVKTRGACKKPHVPVITIPSEENIGEVQASEQRKASSPVSQQKHLEPRSSAQNGPVTRSAAQRSRSEYERSTKNHAGNSRQRNARQSDKILVSTRTVPKEAESVKKEIAKSNAGAPKTGGRNANSRGGGQFRQTPPQTPHSRQYSNRNQKSSPRNEAITGKLELKVEKFCKPKNNALEAIIIDKPNSPEQNGNQGSESTNTENNKSQTQPPIEADEVIPSHAGALTISTDEIDSSGVNNDEKMPESPLVIEEPCTEESVVGPVSVIAIEAVIASETSSVQNIVQKAPEASAPFGAFSASSRRKPPIEMDILKDNQGSSGNGLPSLQKSSFKSSFKVSRGKSNSPRSQSYSKNFWNSPKPVEEKNFLARLMKAEENMKLKIEREAAEKRYSLMFLPDAFSDGSIDEKQITGLYGRFNVDEVRCHYNEAGERIGSGTLRVWDKYTNRIEGRAHDKKWRVLPMIPFKNLEMTAENADQKLNAYVQFLNDWSDEKINNIICKHFAESDFQMIYDYNNQSLKEALVTVKYSDIGKLILLESSTNDLSDGLEVRMFEVPGISVADAVQCK